MAQISRTSNPTDLLNVDRRHVLIRIHGTGTELEFAVESFDYDAAGIPQDAVVACVAHAGNAEEYFQLGYAGAVDDTRHAIAGLDNGHPLRFRLLFTASGDPKLIGFTDGVRPANESGELGPSLVDIEPADLGGPAWKLTLPDSVTGDSKPNILVERQIFPTAYAAARSPWFAGLVMPEVMRQVALTIGAHHESLQDENSWMYPWSLFLDNLRAPPPPENAEDTNAEPNELATWADEVAGLFARSSSMKHVLDFMVSNMQGTEAQ